MKIDIYGALFYDMYIFGEKVHEVKIFEMPGGSGFNIAYTLYKLGHNVKFNSFIGYDRRGKHLRSIIPFKNLEEKKKNTALFISKNEIPVAIERSINDCNFKELKKEADIAIITTELSLKTLEKINKLNYQHIFLDIGPRPFILKQAISIFNNAFIIGNEQECRFKKCNLTKLGMKGILYNNKKYKSNGKKAMYSTGLGDIFDALFIHYLFETKSYEKAIINSIKKTEKVLDIPGPYNKINHIFFKSTP
ncbi:hypothetical protein X275_01615 [Marinitoga sp. 1197]|uniref:hypothetical protein n=1 Tax=Marinitoga sp. 1197 TaxID=1428449 RepID=UPI0006412FA3|nr:hypothetical protein [Marinitoga sp. 1197]KLO23813.1 hypothetical protein X275_01615 [Marinitoga sp. 1197]